MCTGAEAFLLAAASYNAVSSVQQGREQKQLHDFQAEQAHADAQAEREAGVVRADKVRKQGKAQQSEARAALAASGVEVGAGTPEIIQTEITRTHEEDALQEILFGERKGARLDQEGELQTQAGRRAKTAGQRAAVGSLLMAGAQAKGGWRTQSPAPVEERNIAAYRVNR